MVTRSLCLRSLIAEELVDDLAELLQQSEEINEALSMPVSDSLDQSELDDVEDQLRQLEMEDSKNNQQSIASHNTTVHTSEFPAVPTHTPQVEEDATLQAKKLLPTVL